MGATESSYEETKNEFIVWKCSARMSENLPLSLPRKIPVLGKDEDKNDFAYLSSFSSPKRRSIFVHFRKCENEHARLHATHKACFIKIMDCEAPSSDTKLNSKSSLVCFPSLNGFPSRRRIFGFSFTEKFQSTSLSSNQTRFSCANKVQKNLSFLTLLRSRSDRRGMRRSVSFSPYIHVREFGSMVENSSSDEWRRYFE